MRRAALLAALACALAPPDAGASVGSTLQRMAARGAFSGVVLVARHGKVTFAHAYGLANDRTREPNRLSTRFNLASVGKTFTEVAVARLVQEDRLRFSDPIGRYVPDLPAPLHRLTVAQLLDHTSGLGDYFDSANYARLQSHLTTLRAYLPLVSAEAPPGAWHYSNSGYIVLGLIVERVSRESYYDFVRREVWLRAGMTHTACIPRTKVGHGVAIGYTGAVANTAGLPPRGTSAGGCYSTVGDMLRFANALESHRLLGAALTRTLTTAKVKLGPAQEYGYGFGIRLGPKGAPPTIWHNGGSPGVGAEIDINPGLGYTVVVLANRGYPTIQPAIDAVLNQLRIP